MKTIEEKAQAYDEALKEAKKWYKTFVSGQNYPATDIKVSYEWIFPELKENEDEGIKKDIIKNLERYVKCVEDGYDAPSAKDFIVKEIEKQIAWLEKQGETFTKKDVDNSYLQGISDTKHELEKQEKSKWGEEDSLMIDSIIDTIKWLEGKGATNMKIDWLKSLKGRVQPQNRWNPSDEQMMALRRMKAAIAGEGEIYKPLNSLYEDLKKLRDENKKG